MESGETCGSSLITSNKLLCYLSGYGSKKNYKPPSTFFLKTKNKHFLRLWGRNVHKRPLLVDEITMNMANIEITNTWIPAEKLPKGHRIRGCHLPDCKPTFGHTFAFNWPELRFLSGKFCLGEAKMLWFYCKRGTTWYNTCHPQGYNGSESWKRAVDQNHDVENTKTVNWLCFIYVLAFIPFGEWRHPTYLYFWEASNHLVFTNWIKFMKHASNKKITATQESEGNATQSIFVVFWVFLLIIGLSSRKGQ